MDLNQNEETKEVVIRFADQLPDDMQAHMIWIYIDISESQRVLFLEIYDLAKICVLAQLKRQVQEIERAGVSCDYDERYDILRLRPFTTPRYQNYDILMALQWKVADSFSVKGKVFVDSEGRLEATHLSSEKTG